MRRSSKQVGADPTTRITADAISVSVILSRWVDRMRLAIVSDKLFHDPVDGRNDLVNDRARNGRSR